jgi:hypothetical protein
LALMACYFAHFAHILNRDAVVLGIRQRVSGSANRAGLARLAELAEFRLGFEVSQV